MTDLETLVLSITTDGSGDATVNSSYLIYGTLYAVEWVQGTLASGAADATLTVQSTPSGVAYTLLTLTNAAGNAMYYPRALLNDLAGAALTGTSGGDRGLPLIYGKPRVVVAQGGATASGKILLYYYGKAS